MSKSLGVQMSWSPLVPPLLPALGFAFPGLRVGIAEHSAGLTGITFFHFRERAYAAVDVRGGLPGTTFNHALRAAYGKIVSGIAFCGGSACGLEVGVVVNREGQPVLGSLDRRSGLRSLVAEDLRQGKKLPLPTLRLVLA